jgi:tol-pal system protein YbgF
VNKPHWLLAAIVLAVGCSTLTPSEDPVALRMTDIEARLIRVERVVENSSLAELVSEIERLRSESAALRGELETLRFETENSDSRQRELYVDLDRRINGLESAPRSFSPPAVGAPGGPAADPADVPAAVASRPAGSDQQNYEAALDLIESRRYDEANRAFTTFLASFPTSPLADNAQYWLAETHYVRNQYAEGLTQFRRLIESYPQSDKVPDALLKVGFCQAELGERAAARRSLQEVMRQFPGTTAARLASQRLDRLN